jgi:multisubunit Na+/H+ antiporter MnhC subunit
VPTEDAGLLNTFVSAGFYLLFGYFATLWLLRRQSSRAIAFTIVAGAMLGLGVELGKYLRPELVFDPLLAVMILPALVIGTLLGRLVFFNAPA